MQTLLSLLSMSSVRRLLVAAGGVLATLGILALRLINTGRDAERARTDAQSLTNLRNREETEDAVGRLDDATRRERLSRWVRD